MKSDESDTRLRTFGTLICVAFGVIAMSWTTLPASKALPISLAVLALVGFGIPIFRPVRSRLSLCFITFALFAAACGWLAFQFDPVVWLLEWASRLFGEKQSPLKVPPPNSVVQVLVFAATFIAFLASLWWARDNTAMGVHPISISHNFSGAEFCERIASFCNRLKVNLDKLDEETNWSEALFVPLEAEVEVRSDRRRQRRISPLITALKGNFEHRFLLLLGEPGSGKSVALRKLARDLLQEVPKTGRIPVYLNLRDWETPSQWSISSLPKVDEIEVNLRQWVLQNLKDRLDIYARQFLDVYFDPLIQNGRLFFILDSFDEIALLLEVDERHPLIDRFSEAIGHFLGGMHCSRGILASRPFRRPTEQFDAPCQLEIRPLSEERFAQLARRRFLEAGMTHRVMVERPDLAAAARNPFLAALLVQYLTNVARSHQPVRLPASRGEIFADYLSTRLADSGEFLKRDDISPEGLMSALEALAEGMFQTHSSFELALSGLPQLHSTLDNSVLIRAFEQARLVRVGQSVDPHVSFTHRRFAEYLAARNLLRKPDSLPLADIPTDSLWRDTLVLYCEIAPQNEAAKVAGYCWSQVIALREMEKIEDASIWLRGLHCLRFLAEAFRTHPDAILAFRDELYEYVLDKATKGDVLSAKWALEAAGLFAPEQSTKLLDAALKRDNPWLAETALRACRYLRFVDLALYWRFVRAILAKPYVDLWAQRRDLDIAFNANTALRSVRFFFWSVVLDSWVWGLSFVIVPIVLAALYLSNNGVLDVGLSFCSTWLGCFLFYLIAAGALPTWWMTWFMPVHVGGFLLLYRSLGSISFVTGKATSVAVMGFLMVPFFFVPWVVSFIVQLCANGNVRRFVKTRFRKIALATTTALLMAGATLIAVRSAIYCSRRANEVIEFSEKVLWWLWPGVLMSFVIGFPAYAIFRISKAAILDYWHLRQTKNLPEQVTRKWINDILYPLRLLSSRRVFVERLAEVRKVEGEWPAGPPYTGNDWASAELARLDERWRGLDR